MDTGYLVPTYTTNYMEQKEKEIKLLYNTGYTISDMIYFDYGTRITKIRHNVQLHLDTNSGVKILIGHTKPVQTPFE